MPKTYAKFYLDSGGIVRELIMKDEEVKFYINHEKVDIDTYAKIMGHEFPQIMPLLTALKEQIEEEERAKQPSHIQVPYQEGLIHGYHNGTVQVIDELGRLTEFDCEDSELEIMVKYANENCVWFIPTNEYKGEKH